MNKKSYCFIIIFLIIFSVLGLYNFMHPIKNLKDLKDDKKEIISGKIINKSEELGYDENSQKYTIYYLEVEDKNNKENISVELSKDEISKYNINDEINICKDRGIYSVTSEESNQTPKNYGWLVISIVEIGLIIFFIIKLIRK